MSSVESAILFRDMIQSKVPLYLKKASMGSWASHGRGGVGTRLADLYVHFQRARSG